MHGPMYIKSIFKKKTMYRFVVVVVVVVFVVVAAAALDDYEDCDDWCRLLSLFLLYCMWKSLFGYKKKEVTGERIKLHDEELHDLHSLHGAQSFFRS
jgi:hypothetical protein